MIGLLLGLMCSVIEQVSAAREQVLDEIRNQAITIVS